MLTAKDIEHLALNRGIEGLKNALKSNNDYIECPLGAMDALYLFLYKDGKGLSEVLSNENIYFISRVLNFADPEAALCFIEQVSENLDSFHLITNIIRVERIRVAIKNSQRLLQGRETIKVYPVNLHEIQDCLDVVSIADAGLLFRRFAASSERPFTVRAVIERSVDKKVFSTDLSGKLVAEFNIDSSIAIPTETLPREVVIYSLLRDVEQTVAPEGIIFTCENHKCFDRSAGDVFHHVSISGRTPKKKRRGPLGRKINKIDLAFVVPRVGRNNYVHSLIDRGMHLFAYKKLNLDIPIYWVRLSGRTAEGAA